MNGSLVYRLEQQEEIIGGKAVTMTSLSTNHNRTSGNIYRIFRNHLTENDCEPFLGGPTLYLEENIEEYRPDGMVVCGPEKVQEDGVHGAPDLIVEVLSPSTARYDRGHKRDVYEKHGVREYWLVNPMDRSVEQYALENGHFVLRGLYYAHCPEYLLRRLKAEERAELATEFPCGLFPDLTVRLSDVFHRVMPET